MIEQPGLHFKWPHQSARAFDRRLQLDTPPAREMLTRDKKNLEVAWYVSWRIADVEQFLRTVRTLPDASARLEDMAASVLAAELGGHDLGRTGQRRRSVAARRDDECPDRSEWPSRLLGSMALEVVAVRLRRLNYPEEVRSAVFEQIRSERQRVAAATRAEGESQARVIRSAADRERAAVIAEAESDAARHDRRRRGPGRPHRQRGPGRRPRLLPVPQDPRNLPRGPRFQDDAGPLGRQPLPPAPDPGRTRSRRPEAPELAADLERAHGNRDSRRAVAAPPCRP